MNQKTSTVGRAALFADIKAGSPRNHLAYVALYVTADDGKEVAWDFKVCKTNFDLSYEICEAIRFGFDYDVYLADEYDEESLYESIMGESMLVSITDKTVVEEDTPE